MGCASAAEPDADAAPRISTIYTRASTASAASGPAGALVARARERGSVRVIVGLDMKMRFKAKVSASEHESQRGKLRAAQDRVVGRVRGSAGSDGVSRFDTIPYVSMFVDAGQLERLLGDAEVVSVQEDVPVPPLYDSTRIIHADDLAREDVKGKGHVVAILDTGVASRHPMLDDKVVSEACYSTNDETKTFKSVCNGGAEVVIGDGTGTYCELAIAGCDHGTHVASTAAGDAGVRLRGVARSADIIAIQVFTEQKNCRGRKSCAVSFQTDQIKALERVLTLTDKFNIDAANMSLGGGKFSVVCDSDNAAIKAAIDNLRAAGVATVIASGNTGEENAVSSPACISSAIAVGNTTKDDFISKTSNHSNIVKLMAPGTDIEGAIPPKGYEFMTGTSMAAPHVSGAFALMRDAKPTATLDNILAALQCSGKTVHRRQDDAGDFEITPQKPRIDVLGAYSWLRAPPDNKRVWPFNKTDDELDWSPVLGKWKVTDGSYKQQPVQEGWVGSLVGNCSRAVTIEAVMKRDDPGKTVFSNSGFFFRANFTQVSKAGAGYFVAYNKCPTNISGVCTNAPGDPPGQALFYTVTFVDLIKNSAFGSLNCRKQVKVNPDKQNTVKVVSEGSTHSFFLNGKLVCSVTDSTFATGSVMLAAFLASGGGQAYQVDTVTTRSTDPGPSLAAPDVIDPAAAGASIPGALSLDVATPVLQSAER